MPLTPGERRRIKDWPPTLVQIAEVVGIECAETIARTLGGTTVYLGQQQRGPAASRLSDLIGAHRYAALAQHFTSGIGQVELDISAGPFLAFNQARRMQNDLFWDAMDHCTSVSEAARYVGMSVRNIARKMRKIGMTAADLKSNSKGTDR